MAIVTTYQAFAKNETGLTTYTFTSQPIGTASATRVVAVTIGSRGGTTGTTVSSVTIGGETATIVQQENTGSNSNIAAIAVAVVPTGTTATVVVTFSSSRTRCAIGVYDLTGAGSSVTNSAASNADDPTLSITVASGGAIIACAATSNSASLTTWSNVTENYDELVLTTMYCTGASADFASGSTVSVGLDYATSTSNGVAIGISLSELASGTTYTQLERQIRGVNRGVYSGP